ncbi:MAG: protein-export chaperone SecB [Alphaproteobacteria bacterium]
MSQKKSSPVKKEVKDLVQENGPSLINSANYIKDLSFENPGVLKDFSDGQTSPELNINVHVDVTPVGEHVYEVVLMLKAAANHHKEALFLLELSYGGIFRVDESFGDDERKRMLLIDAPSLLFPFARTIVANLTREGGLPPLLLNPVNFEDMYRQTVNEETKLKH